MADQPPPLNKPGGIHALTWWALALNILGVIFFAGGFIWAASSPKGSDKSWLGDAWMVMIFILAPLCTLGAGVTGIMGAAKRKGCLAVGIALVPVLVVVLMVLFLWAALLGASRFR